MGIRIERRVRFGDTDPYGALFFSSISPEWKSIPLPETIRKIARP